MFIFIIISYVIVSQGKEKPTRSCMSNKLIQCKIPDDNIVFLSLFTLSTKIFMKEKLTIIEILLKLKNNQKKSWIDFDRFY